MKPKNIIVGTKISKIFFMLLISILIVSCSTTARKYYFSCNEQSSTIIDKYIPSVLFSMGYDFNISATTINYFEGIKKIKTTNKKNGIETESIILQIQFNYDTTKSVITQMHVVENTNKKTIKPLNKEQLEKYEKDALLFKEKMEFYCNPAFEGR